LVIASLRRIYERRGELVELIFDYLIKAGVYSRGTLMALALLGDDIDPSQSSSTRKAQLPDSPFQTSSTKKRKGYSLIKGTLNRLLTLQQRMTDFDTLADREQVVLTPLYENITARGPPLARAVFEHAAFECSQYPQVIKDELIRLQSLAEKSWIYEFMLSLFDGDKDALNETIWQEATATGRTFSQVVLGSVGENSLPQPQDLSLAFAAPNEKSPEADFNNFCTVFGGGGFNTSGLVRAILEIFRKLPSEQKDQILNKLKLFVVQDTTSFDNGGHSLSLQVLLYFVYKELSISVGDYNAGLMFQLLETWFKKGDVDYVPTLVNPKIDLLLVGSKRLDLRKDSMVDIMKRRLSQLHPMPVLQYEEVAVQLERPADWLFFISNMLNIAHLLDTEFLSQGHMRDQDRASGGNLVCAAATIDNGVIAKGRHNPERGLRHVHTLLGTQPHTYTTIASFGQASLTGHFPEGKGVVYGQSAITDPMPKPHAELLEYLDFMRALIDPETGKFVTREEDGKKIIVCETLSLDQRPEMNLETRRLIQRAQGVLVVGGGSPVTSAAPAVMPRGVALRFAERQDIPRIFLLKPVTDLEVSVPLDESGDFRALSLLDIINLIQLSIKNTTEEEVPFNQMFSYLFIPKVPQEHELAHNAEGRRKLLESTIKDSDTGEKVAVLNEEGLQRIREIPEDAPFERLVAVATDTLLRGEFLTPTGANELKSKNLKPSKFLNFPVVRISDDDIQEALQIQRGLEIVLLDRPQDYMFWAPPRTGLSAKLHYNPDSISKRVVNVAARTNSEWSFLQTSSTRKKNEGIPDKLSSFPAVINVVAEVGSAAEVLLPEVAVSLDAIQIDVRGIYRAFTLYLEKREDISSEELFAEALEPMELRYDYSSSEVTLDGEKITAILDKASSGSDDSSIKALEATMLDYVPAMLVINSKLHDVFCDLTREVDKPILISIAGFHPDVIFNLYVTALREKRVERLLAIPSATRESSRESCLQYMYQQDESLSDVDERYKDVFSILDTTYMHDKEVKDVLLISIGAMAYNHSREVKLREWMLEELKKDIADDPEGVGTFSLIAFKAGEVGGLEPQTNKMLLAQLERCKFSIRPYHIIPINTKTMLKRWFAGEGAGPKFVLKRMSKEVNDGSFAREGALAMDLLDPYRFNAWFDRISSPRMTRISNASRTIQFIRWYLQRDLQMVQLVRTTSRSDVLATLGISYAHAKELLGLEKEEDVDRVPEQMFVKKIVVGPTNPGEVIVGQLRSIAMINLSSPQGPLRAVLKHGERMRLGDANMSAAKRIEYTANAVHASSLDELENEFSLISHAVTRVGIVNFASPKSVSECQWCLPSQILAGHLRRYTSSLVVLFDMERVLIQEERRQEAQLQENGARVDDIEQRIQERKYAAVESIVERVEKYRPHVLEISMGLEFDDSAAELIEGIFSRMGDRAPLIVLGKIGTAAEARELLSREELKNIIVIIGETEIAMEKIVDIIDRNPNDFSPQESLYANVPNIAFREGDRIVETHHQPLELERYSFPGDNEAIEYFVRPGSCVATVAPVETSRLSPWRAYPLSDILAVMAKLVNNGQRAFQIVDQDFTGPAETEMGFQRAIERLRTLAEGLRDIKSGLQASGDDPVQIVEMRVGKNVFYNPDGPDRTSRSQEVLNSLMIAGVNKIVVTSDSDDRNFQLIIESGIEAEKDQGPQENLQTSSTRKGPIDQGLVDRLAKISSLAQTYYQSASSSVVFSVTPWDIEQGVWKPEYGISSTFFGGERILGLVNREVKASLAKKLGVREENLPLTFVEPESSHVTLSGFKTQDAPLSIETIRRQNNASVDIITRRLNAPVEFQAVGLNMFVAENKLVLFIPQLITSQAMEVLSTIDQEHQKVLPDDTLIYPAYTPHMTVAYGLGEASQQFLKALGQVKQELNNRTWGAFNAQRVGLYYFYDISFTNGRLLWERDLNSLENHQFLLQTSSTRKATGDSGSRVPVIAYDFDGTVNSTRMEDNFRGSPCYGPVLRLAYDGYRQRVVSNNGILNLSRSFEPFVPREVRKQFGIYAYRTTRHYLYEETSGQRYEDKDYAKGKVLSSVQVKMIQDIIPAMVEKTKHIYKQVYREFFTRHPDYFSEFEALSVFNCGEDNQSGEVSFLMFDPMQGTAADFIKEADILGADNKLVARQRLRDAIEEALPGSLLRELEVRLAFGHAIIVIKKGFSKKVGVSHILEVDGVEPHNLFYFGDESGTKDEEDSDAVVASLGVLGIGVDSDQNRIAQGVIAGGLGLTNTMATAWWLRLIPNLDKFYEFCRGVASGSIDEALVQFSPLFRKRAEGIKMLESIILLEMKKQELGKADPQVLQGAAKALELMGTDSSLQTSSTRKVQSNLGEENKSKHDVIKGSAFAFLDVALVSLGIILNKIILSQNVVEASGLSGRVLVAVWYGFTLVTFASFWIMAAYFVRYLYNRARNRNSETLRQALFPEIDLYRNLPARDKKLLFWGSLFSHILGGLTFQIGLTLLSPKVAMFSFQIILIFSFVLGWLILKESPTLRKIIGSSLVLFGVLMVLSLFSGSSGSGDLEASGILRTIGIIIIVSSALIYASERVVHKAFFVPSKLSAEEQLKGQDRSQLAVTKFGYNLAMIILLPPVLFAYFSGAISFPWLISPLVIFGPAIIFPLAHMAVYTAQKVKGFGVIHLAPILAAGPIITTLFEGLVFGSWPKQIYWFLFMGAIVIYGVYVSSSGKNKNNKLQTSSTRKANDESRQDLTAKVKRAKQVFGEKVVKDELDLNYDFQQEAEQLRRQTFIQGNKGGRKVISWLPCRLIVLPLLKCPANCAHCSVIGNTYNNREMSMDEVAKTLDMEDIFIERSILILSGGEILLLGEKLNKIIRRFPVLALQTNSVTINTVGKAKRFLDLAQASFRGQVSYWQSSSPREYQPREEWDRHQRAWAEIATEWHNHVRSNIEEIMQMLISTSFDDFHLEQYPIVSVGKIANLIEAIFDYLPELSMGIFFINNKTDFDPLIKELTQRGFEASLNKEQDCILLKGRGGKSGKIDLFGMNLSRRGMALYLGNEYFSEDIAQPVPYSGLRGQYGGFGRAIVNCQGDFTFAGEFLPEHSPLVFGNILQEKNWGTILRRLDKDPLFRSFVNLYADIAEIAEEHFPDVVNAIRLGRPGNFETFIYWVLSNPERKLFITYKLLNDYYQRGILTGNNPFQGRPDTEIKSFAQDQVSQLRTQFKAQEPQHNEPPLQTSSTRKHASTRRDAIDLMHPDLTGTGQRIRSAAAAVLRFEEREQEGISILEEIIIEEDRKRQSSQHDIDVLFGAVVSRNLLGESDNPIVQTYQRDLKWLPDDKGRRDLH
ncbi:MAG: EamA family transporter, partial [Omnitrophica bacterium]|nr:EamA family transporter [Candidatus Omnitrophota bacterium]